MSNLIHHKTPFVAQAAAISLAGASLCLAALTAFHAALAPLCPLDLFLQGKIHAHPTPWLNALMLAFTGIGSIRVFGTALAIVLAGLLVRGQRHAAALLTYALSGALILNEALKLHFQRARPILPWSIGDEHTFSFPSGHSFFSVVLYGTLAYLALRHGAPPRRVLPTAIFLPFAIGTSRIYLGEHYPTDVLAGWLCGLVWLATILLLDRRWRRQTRRSHSQEARVG